MPDGRRFPDTDVRDLDGRELRLPGALPGPLDVVVLAFRRGQQTDVDGWRDAVAELGADAPGFWEVPAIGTMWRPLRGWIDGGMASAIPDPQIRSHTLTAYTDTGTLRRELGIRGPGEIATLLVRDADVVWEARGPTTPAAVADLAGALTRLRGDT